MEGRHVQYEEGTVNLQVEDMRKINMEVKKNKTVNDVIYAHMLKLSLNAGLKRFGKKGEEASRK